MYTHVNKHTKLSIILLCVYRTWLHQSEHGVTLSRRETNWQMKSLTVPLESEFMPFKVPLVDRRAM